MDAEALARLRAAVGRLNRRLSAAAQGSDLTPTQMWVLTEIVRHGPIGVGELATSEALNPTMLSRVVGKLEDAGLVSRTNDPVDRRVTFVEPTAAGRRLKQRIQQQRTAELAERLELLSPGQTE
ncbi:MAG: MarR family winged helix-turn-helix transcriptional regulator, partial [Acidothermaceae bacterium]